MYDDFNCVDGKAHTVETVGFENCKNVFKMKMANCFKNFICRCNISVVGCIFNIARAVLCVNSVLFFWV